MRRFLCKNATFLFLVVITTIDASRIFYLPLPKIHSSHHESESSPSVQQSAKQTVSDELIPISAMERNMYEEQDEEEEDQKRDFVDWEPSLTKKNRHHILVNERSHGSEEKFNYMISSNDERQLSSNTDLNDDLDANIDSLSRNNGNDPSDETWNADTATARAARLQSNEVSEDVERQKRRNDALFLVIVGTCSLVGVVGLVAAAVFWYKIQKRAETALDAEYPSYGVTGPSSGSKVSPSSTMKLAQSAQMFHYQERLQQMMAQEKAQLDTKSVHSDDSDDETPAGGDYTVYECPGLAPTGEMEVRNPLFTEPDSSLNSSTFASHPTTNNHYPQLSTASPSSSPPKEKSLS
jgi:hypothetical protein